jgi:dinuclear metal center YbgI/SA1388 family protein
MQSQPKKNTTTGQILQALENLAPPELAAEWDLSIGLEIGHPDTPVDRVLLTLDVTEQAVDMALSRSCQLILAHHPLFFSPLPAIRLDVPEQRLIARILREGLGLISAHTNLDAADGGVADCLADTLGLDATDRQKVGLYGRCGNLPRPMLISELFPYIREKLGSPGCRINRDQDLEVRKLAVFPGSFGEESLPFLEQMGINVLLCGELKHHLALQLAARGITVIDAGHDVTERVVLKPLSARLARLLPEIIFAVHEGLDYNGVAFRANQTTAGDGRKTTHEESPGSIG